MTKNLGFNYSFLSIFRIDQRDDYDDLKKLKQFDAKNIKIRLKL